MDKIITRIPKHKARQMKAYNYELNKNVNEIKTPLPIETTKDITNSLNSGNESESTRVTYEPSYEDTKQEESVNKDSINISQPSVTENYAEVLILKLLKQKLRHLKSNDVSLSYHYQGNI